MKLPANNCMNWNSVHICLPIQIKSKKDSTDDIHPAIITLIKFVAPWIKQIDIKRYKDHLEILPTGNSTDIYRYSHAMLKHMLKDALKSTCFPEYVFL